MHGSSDAVSTTPSDDFDKQAALDMVAAVELGNKRLVEKVF
jgi:hypothetical protein